MLTRCQKCNRVYDGDVYDTCPYETASSVVRCAACGRIYDSRNTSQCPHCPPVLPGMAEAGPDFVVCPEGHAYRRDLHDVCPACQLPQAEKAKAVTIPGWPVWLAAGFAISALPFGVALMWLFSRSRWQWPIPRSVDLGAVAAMFVIAAASLAARKWRGSKLSGVERGLYWLGVALVASTFGLVSVEIMGLDKSRPIAVILSIELIGSWLVLGSVAAKLARWPIGGVEAGLYWLGGTVAAVIAGLNLIQRTKWTIPGFGAGETAIVSACVLVLVTTALAAWSRSSRLTRGEMVLYWICSAPALLLGSVLFIYPGLSAWEQSQNRLIVSGIILFGIALCFISLRRRRTWPLAIPAAAYAMALAASLVMPAGRRSPTSEQAITRDAHGSRPVVAADGQMSAAPTEFEVRTGSNLLGTMLAKLITSNVNDCVTRCRETSDCSGFVFYEAVLPGPYVHGRMQLRSPAQCTLHTGAVEPVRDARATAYIARQGARQAEPRLVAPPELAERKAREADVSGLKAGRSDCDSIFVGTWGSDQGACKKSNFDFGHADVKILFTSSAVQYLTVNESYGCTYTRTGLMGQSCTYAAACSGGRSYRDVKRGDISLQESGGRLTGMGPDGQQFALQKCN